MARGQNIASKVYNKPLLITLDDLQPIADYLSNPERLASVKLESVEDTAPKLADYSDEGAYKKALMKHLKYNDVTKVGVLSVDGVLVNREGQMNANCTELTSYQALKKQFEAQVALGMKSCVMMISSGGGECYGAWGTANYIKKIAKEKDIKLTAYVDGSACSAAYVWAVVADEIVSNPLGNVGSIGVLVQLYNDSKRLDDMGIKRSFVYAGGNKIPFDKEGNFTDKFISDLQSSVDKTYQKFVTHVSVNRGLSEEAVVKTNASVFDAEDALSLGLIDKIMELEDFETTYNLKTQSTRSGQHALQASTTNTNLQHEDTMSKQDMTVEQLQASLDALTAEKETLQTSFADLTAQLEALQGEKATLLAEKEALAKEKLEAEEAAAQTALQARLDKREATLKGVFGVDSPMVASLLETTSEMSEEAFDVLAQGFGVQKEQAASDLEEKGDDGEPTEQQLSLSDLIASHIK